MWIYTNVHYAEKIDALKEFNSGNTQAANNGSTADVQESARVTNTHVSRAYAADMVKDHLRWNGVEMRLSQVSFFLVYLQTSFFFCFASIFPFVLVV